MNIYLAPAELPENDLQRQIRSVVAEDFARRGFEVESPDLIHEGLVDAADLRGYDAFVADITWADSKAESLFAVTALALGKEVLFYSTEQGNGGAMGLKPQAPARPTMLRERYGHQENINVKSATTPLTARQMTWLFTLVALNDSRQPAPGELYGAKGSGYVSDRSIYLEKHRLHKAAKLRRRNG